MAAADGRRLTADARGSRPQGAALKRFIAAPPAEQSRQFKMISNVSAGPFIMRNAIPKKPVILGKAIGRDLPPTPRIAPLRCPGSHLCRALRRLGGEGPGRSAPLPLLPLLLACCEHTGAS